MADLYNILDHMHGMAVLVDGTTYKIDEMGVAHDVSEKDAEKLLLGPHWRVHDPKSEQARRMRAAQAAKDKAGAKRGAILADGTLVETETPPKAPEQDVGVITEDQRLAGFDPESKEYPDPVESMKKEQLQALCRVYQVPYEEKDTKAGLVELLNKAMYG